MLTSSTSSFANLRLVVESVPCLPDPAPSPRHLFEQPVKCCQLIALGWNPSPGIAFSQGKLPLPRLFVHPWDNTYPRSRENTKPSPCFNLWQISRAIPVPALTVGQPEMCITVTRWQMLSLPHNLLHWHLCPRDCFQGNLKHSSKPALQPFETQHSNYVLSSFQTFAQAVSAAWNAVPSP